jgi:hypothetical protein
MTLDQVTERAVRAGLRTDETGAVWGNVEALRRYSTQLVADLMAARGPDRTGSAHCEKACEANAFQIEIRRLQAALEHQRRPGFDQVDEGDYDLGLDGRPNRDRR